MDHKKKTQSTMSTSQTQSALIPCLRAVWQRIQRKHLSAGFLTLLRWGIPLFLLGVAIDWLTYMPSLGRSIILLVLLGISIYKAWQHGWRYLKPFNPTRAALEVEKLHGGLESLLVTAVQFKESKMAAGTSEALVNATCSKAEGTAGELQPRKIINFKSLKTPFYMASALAGLVLLFALINGPFLSAGLARLFTPWTDIAYPTKTQLDLETKALVVKEGDSAKITIGVSGVIPDTAQFYLRTGDGDPREIEIPVENGSIEYKLASASRDFSYRIKAGDARSDWHQVKVIAAPRIENVQVKLEFPSYLDRKNETVEAMTLTVPQGTKLYWTINLDRPIRDAVLHRDGKKPLSLEVSNDGRQVIVEEAVEASRGYNFSWVEKEHGFDFTSPRYYLQVASDQAPRVELISPVSNLLAMIGRPLDLSVRVQDDHGIGSTAIAYRVNQLEEKSIKLKTNPENGKGEQSIDWDYRKVLPELKIGDTVSVTVEVSDRFPGKDGPHLARSDTRRITFLSEKAYLRQIQKNKDSLLTRVQAIYRQQRAAFDSVRVLETKSETYIQTCQIEAIRQELVRDQLKQIASEVKFLLDDLAANNVSDAPEGESLEFVQKALLEIAETHLANAASLLRHQSGLAAGDTKDLPDPSSAARAVNTAARELGSIVLLRSIDTAQEVYAREARMLAQIQSSLRWRTVQAKSTEERSSLAKEQDELAQWTQRLMNDLQKGMRFEKRPLAVLRLIQSVKDLKTVQTEERMIQAAEFITKGETDKAENLQADLVTTLLDAEFSVRLSGAYLTLTKTRDDMRILVKAQAMLREQCAGMKAQALKEKTGQITQDQNKLRQSLLTLLLPTVPAPQAKLLDETFPQIPAIHTLLKGADRGMAEALKHLAAGEQEAAIKQQQDAEQAMANLAELVDQWTIELGIQTLGLTTTVAASSERLALITDFEAKLIALLEKTDAAAAAEEKLEGLAVPQLMLAKEIEAFNDNLTQQNQTNPDQDIPPLLSRMKRAEIAMQKALASMKANDADQTLSNQEQVADILAETLAIVTRQNEQLGMLQSLMMFQRSVEFANGYVSDIVAEQKDLIKATNALKKDDASGILPMFALLRRCMDEVAPLLDLVAARVDAGQPLAFASSDLDEAVVSLEDGDKVDALDAQDVAAESLEELQVLVKAAKTQTGYIAEIVEFLHAAVANNVLLEYQQDELKQKAQSANPEQLKAIAKEQSELFNKAERESQALTVVTGKAEFSKPVELMRGVPAQLSSNETEAAIDQMTIVSAALKENTESLFNLISVIHGLPNLDIELMIVTDPSIERLIDVLAVASAHKVLFRETNALKPEEIKAMAKRQSDLASRCQKLAEVGEKHAMLVTASAELTKAATATQSANQEDTKRSQKLAMQSLQYFIIEQAQVLNTVTPPPTPSDAPAADGPGSDSESAFSAGFISDFVSGEAPKDKRAGWDVRADRNRAALNQNFARQLPLEYRGLLKNYYERIAK